MLLVYFTALGLVQKLYPKLRVLAPPPPPHPPLSLALALPLKAFRNVYSEELGLV